MCCQIHSLHSGRGCLQPCRFLLLMRCNSGFPVLFRRHHSNSLLLLCHPVLKGLLHPHAHCTGSCSCFFVLSRFPVYHLPVLWCFLLLFWLSGLYRTGFWQFPCRFQLFPVLPCLLRKGLWWFCRFLSFLFYSLPRYICRCLCPLLLSLFSADSIRCIHSWLHLILSSLHFWLRPLPVLLCICQSSLLVHLTIYLIQ